MKTQLRALALTTATLLTSAGTVQAQNTYQDFPFQQGSLFYRPSGAKPPKQVYRAPAYQYPVTNARVAPGYVQTPATTTYRQPVAANNPVTGTRYVYPTRRRGLFGWWR
jgi:hypothetical protein